MTDRLHNLLSGEFSDAGLPDEWMAIVEDEPGGELSLSELRRTDPQLASRLVAMRNDRRALVLAPVDSAPAGLASASIGVALDEPVALPAESILHAERSAPAAPPRVQAPSGPGVAEGVLARVGAALSEAFSLRVVAAASLALLVGGGVWLVIGQMGDAVFDPARPGEPRSVGTMANNDDTATPIDQNAIASNDGGATPAGVDEAAEKAQDAPVIAGDAQAEPEAITPQRAAELMAEGRLAIVVESKQIRRTWQRLSVLSESPRPRAAPDAVLVRDAGPQGAAMRRAIARARESLDLVNPGPPPVIFADDDIDHPGVVDPSRGMLPTIEPPPAPVYIAEGAATPDGLDALVETLAFLPGERVRFVELVRPVQVEGDAELTVDELLWWRAAGAGLAPRAFAPVFVEGARD